MLLAKGHRLERLEQKFRADRNESMLRYLFAHGLNSGFLQHLMNISDLGEFRLSPGPILERDVGLLKDLKSALERGHQETSNRGSMDHKENLTARLARKKKKLELIMADIQSRVDSIDTLYAEIAVSIYSSGHKWNIINYMK